MRGEVADAARELRMIAIVDYEAGNLTSVKLAFETLGADARITREPRVILDAERVVFPGVGAAGSAMSNIRRLGLAEPLRAVVSRETPFLGICLGTQIVFERSEEDGGVETLGILGGSVRLFRPADRSCKVPQIGWNTVRFARQHPLLDGIDDESEFYFIHSYYPDPSDPRDAVGHTEYAGVRFASIAGRGALAVTQFHPEKSGRIGLKLLENFCRWDGKC